MIVYIAPVLYRPAGPEDGRLTRQAMYGSTRDPRLLTLYAQFFEKINAPNHAPHDVEPKEQDPHPRVRHSPPETSPRQKTMPLINRSFNCLKSHKSHNSILYGQTGCAFRQLTLDTLETVPRIAKHKHCNEFGKNE